MSNDGIQLFLQEIVDTIFDGLMRNSVSIYWVSVPAAVSSTIDISPSKGTE